MIAATLSTATLACEATPVQQGSAAADAGAAPSGAPPPEPAPTVVVIPTQTAEPRSVGAAQILVTWKGAEGAPAAVTRTKVDARRRADAALELVRAGKKPFEDVVAEYSDDPQAKATRGAIGNFERYAMPRAFADAAFALAIDGVSGVVETPRGFHVIKRLR